MYIELYDLMYLSALQKGDCDVEISLKSDNSNAEQTRQVLRGEFKTYKNRLNKTNDNFFHRTKALYNQMIRKYKIYGQYRNKDRLLTIYWNFFNRFFTPDNKCTWRILCRCGSCNPMSKLITTENSDCINRLKTID